MREYLQKQIVLSFLMAGMSALSQFASIRHRGMDMAGLRADGVFNEGELKHMHRAYGLAVAALALTHAVDDHDRMLLADCLLRETMTQREFAIDVCRLAARSIDRYISMCNSFLDHSSATIH